MVPSRDALEDEAHLQGDQVRVRDRRVVRRLVDEAARYLSWMQWSLWDLPAFAVAIKPDPDAFRHQVTACGMVYIAIRVFDDPSIT